MDNQNIILSVNSFGVVNNIYVTQGDTGRQVICQIADYQIPEGSTAKFFAKKPSGLQIYNSASVSDNKVTFPLTSQTIAEIGVTEGQVEITEPDGKVSSFIFRINVQPTLSGDYPESKNESTFLEQTLEDMQNQINESVSAANTATANANEAAEKANDAAAAAGELPKRVDEIESEVDNLYDMTNGKSVDDNAYSVTVSNGAKFATVKKLGGKSIAWNQLVKTYNPGKSNNGINFTVDKERGKITADGTATADTRFPMTSFPVVAGHKYLLMGNFIDQIMKENIYMNCTDNVNSSNSIIIQKRAAIKEISVSVENYNMYIFVRNGTVLKNNCFIPQAFDLTQMFGQGNEPTVEEFEAMFPENFYTGNDGEVISAEVAKTRSIGKNLFSTQEMVGAFARALTLSKNEDGIIWIPPATTGNNAVPIFKGCFKPNTRYTFFIKNAAENPTDPYTNLRVNFTDGTYSDLRFDSNENYDYTFYSTPKDMSVDTLSSIWQAAVSQINLNESAIVEGYYDNPEDIPPYKCIESSVPESIKSLDGYGWSAGDVYNEVDFENKKFIKRVEHVLYDGSLPYNCDDNYMHPEYEYNYIYSIVTRNKTKTGGSSISILGRTNNLNDYAQSGQTLSIVVALFIPNQATENITKIDYINKCKQWLTENPIDIYYELAEPVITDISDILDSFEVESGGTISFVQSDDTKHLPVPNTIEYDSSGADKIAQLEKKINDVKTEADSAVSGVNNLQTDFNKQIITINQDLCKHLGLYEGNDLNDINQNSSYILSSSKTYSNMPTGFTSGYLFTDSSEKEYDEYMQQLLFSIYGIARRTKVNGVWNEWFVYRRTEININTELGSISGINLKNYPNGYSIIDMPINSVIVCDGSVLSAKTENKLSELSTGYNYHVEKIGSSPFSVVYVTGISGSMRMGWINDTERTVTWFDLSKGYTHLNNVDYELELGNYGTVHPDYISSNTRARITLPIQVCNKIVITPSEDIKFSVRLLDENLTLIYSTDWIDTETTYREKDCFYILVSIAYDDDRVLSESDFDTLKEKFAIMRDGTPIALKKLKIEAVAHGQDLSWKSPNCVSMISVKYKRISGKQPVPIAWLYRDNTEPYNFYVSNGSSDLVKLFEWNKSVTFDGNQPPINYSIAITTEGDIICVYRGEKAQYDGLTKLRQNPIVYPHGDYEHPVVVDFGSDDAPTSWLQNCGYYAEEGKLFTCEYTRTSFAKSYVWKAVAPYTNKGNWTKIKSFDVSGTNLGFKHCHMVDKDPYTGILYLSTGDHDVGANIFYSTDDGTSWNTLIAENEKYSRQLNFIWCKDKIYWATDTTTIGTHFLFEAKRNSNGIIDVENIKELYEFYTNSATYNVCYSEDAKGLLILERFDSATTTPLNVYFYDILREKMTIIDRLSTNFPSLYGFRVEAINTYQGITDRRFICGFSLYPNQIAVNGSVGNTYANTDNGMVTSDYGNVGNINNLCLTVLN